MASSIFENKAFLGRGWAFPVNFKRGENTVVLSQFEKDIQESLIILLSTIRGERVLRPDFGTSVYDLLFEPVDLSIATLIADEIKRAILIHEPRVFVDKVEAMQESLQGKLELSINYTIIASNTRSNLVFPFYLNEGTEI